MTLMTVLSTSTIKILYRNYRDEVKWREISPSSLSFDLNKYYKEKQWLLDAYDAEKGEPRAFALANILAYSFGFGDVWINKNVREICGDYYVWCDKRRMYINGNERLLNNGDFILPGDQEWSPRRDAWVLAENVGSLFMGGHAVRRKFRDKVTNG